MLNRRSSARNRVGMLLAAVLAAGSIASSGISVRVASAQIPPGGTPDPVNPSIYSYHCPPLYVYPPSMTPITTTNFVGSCTTFAKPATPGVLSVQVAPVAIFSSSSTGGSYCILGDEQIWVPTGASPASYGC